MCGIVGYVGPMRDLRILTNALKRLEYRGYDSAGVTLLKDGLKVYKDKGRIRDLEASLPDVSVNIGIGHTRWATHGAPSKANAHPHTDCTGDIAIVHNGIIENFMELKRDLAEKGHEFVSDTDTEVIAHLFEEYFHGDLKSTMLRVSEELDGSYAVVGIHRDHPGELIAFRQYSPLVLGLAEDMNLVASDVPAILGETNRVVYLQDGQGALIRRDGVTLFDDRGEELTPEISVIDWTLEDAEKGGYEHFMLKEIFEQPKAIRDSMLSKMSRNGRVKTASLLSRDVDSIKIIACGTSYHAGLVGKYAITHLTRLPCTVEIGSEYRYTDHTNETALTVFISQSGETADTLAAAKESANRGLTTMGITNVVGSSLTREVDEVIYTNAGPEIGVAATKSFITQLVVLYLIGIQLGSYCGTITPERMRALYGHLRNTPRVVEKVLANTRPIERVGREMAEARSVFFIGRNINYPMALEGALKLKEISYVHAEGYPAGELKHGPIALLTEMTPVVAVAPDDFIYKKMSSNIGEVLARDAPVVCVVSESDTEMEKYVNHTLKIPAIDPLLTPIPVSVVLQLLAYYCAEERGCSIDKPRNLAKSVTVE